MAANNMNRFAEKTLVWHVRHVGQLLYCVGLRSSITILEKAVTYTLRSAEKAQ